MLFYYSSLSYFRQSQVSLKLILYNSSSKSIMNSTEFLRLHMLSVRGDCGSAGRAVVYLFNIEHLGLSFLCVLYVPTTAQSRAQCVTWSQT